MRDQNNRQRNYSQESNASQLAVKSNGKNMRRSSNSSIDSRTVALEMANEEEEELLGVIEDVKGFLKRPDGIPSYISKEHLFVELIRILKNPSLTSDKKAEAIDTSAALLKSISSKTNRRKASKATVDMSACLDIVLPSVINQLASKEADMQQASLRLLQQCLEDDDPNGVSINDTLDHLADNGVRHKSDRISVEVIKLLPGIYQEQLENLDLEPIFAALYDQLEIRNRDNFAFSALLRHREALGPEVFSRYSSKMEPRQRNTFRILSQSFEDKDFHVVKKRPKEGVSFGMVPNQIINRLLDKQNRTIRAEGALMLKRELENAAKNEPPRFAMILPYTGSFIKFLGSLLGDASPKVVIHILECHDIMLNHAQQAMRQHVVQTTHNLLRICNEAKLQIKIELFTLMKSVMQASGPQSVVEVLLPEADHKNAKMREDVVNFIIFALLTFPSKEFDLAEVCSNIVPSLLDTKRRVRQAALECMAVIHQCLGKGKDGIIWTCIDHADTGLYDDNEEISEATHYRLSRKVLPKITEEGFIEYGLQIPYNYQTRAANNNGIKGKSSKKSDFGPDVDWILKGSGSVSRGSAGSVNQSLGVNGASGALYGSSVSLQSSRASDSSGSSSRSRKLQRSSSSGTVSNWSGKAPIPSIVRSKESQSASPPTSNTNEGQTSLRRRSTSEGAEYGPTTETEYPEEEELEPVNEDLPVMTDEEEEKRKSTYDTIPRSMSELSLQETPPQPTQKRKNSLSSLHEESESKPQSAVPPQEETLDEEEESYAKSDKKGNSSFKKNSLASLGLAASEYQTQFDEEEAGLDDEEAPGAFKRPASAFKLARSDMRSQSWQTEIEGLAAIVRLIKYHRDIILGDLDGVIKELNHECKNLRSQVTRAAIQTFVIMFSFLGKNIEAAKSLDASLVLLLTKTADTNRFIRYDANEALDAFSENCTVLRVASSLERLGIAHKNVVARTTSGRILAQLSEALGTEAIYEALTSKDSREAAESLFRSASLLMTDGSLDVRQEAKRILTVLMGNERFESVLKACVDPELVKKIRKQLDALLKQIQDNQ